MSERYRDIEPRVKTVEEAVRLLTDLALRADELMDGFDSDLTNLTVKLEALTDAQIRTEKAMAHLAGSHQRMEESHTRLEDAHTRLEDAHTRLEEAMGRLAETQAHSDRRLNALIEIVREEREHRGEK
jgi:hypothetical protein